MNPAKITIQGDFWDCQIYRGRLYLWESNGILRVVDWNDLVRSFISSPEEELALTCAFLDGRYLYASNLKVLFEDPDFKELLTQKFNFLINRNLNLSNEDLETFTLSTQDNPFKELQTDSEIINNQIIALTYMGLYSANAHRPKSNKYLVKTKTNKINDFVGFSIKAGKYGRLALSGGNDGLYELDLARPRRHYFHDFARDEKSQWNQVSEKHSSFADFNFLSLYNSSVIGKSFLSLYTLPDRDFKNANKKKQLEKEVSETEIFGHNGNNSLSWGTNEKLYKATGNILEVVNFNNYPKEDDNYFSEKQQFQFQAWKGKILKGGTAYFGTIIECENAIVVLEGENEFYNIPGEATRWRVYPRSFNYENHLHVIKDDCLEVYSFNHDYFRNQWEKDFGIRFAEEFYVRPNRF